MQPGYPGQDPYGQQPSDPNAPQQPTPGQPAPGQPYQDPYGQQPVSGQPYGAAPTYPGAGYPTPGQGQNNTLGLIAMIVGIVSIVLGICCGLFSLPASIAAIVLGVLGRNKVTKGEASNGGQAMAGIICGGVAVVIAIIMVALGAALNLGAIG
jgi:hypothetical protein